MTEDLGKLSFLERRLTNFERELEALKASISASHVAKAPERRVMISCDAPGVIASQAYETERANGQGAFCWIGSEATIQIILPVAPVAASTCKILMIPHGEVDFTKLTLFVNDIQTVHRIVKSGKQELMIFAVPGSSWPHIEVNFQGLISVRPVDLGENEDRRWLAFRFYSAEIEYHLDDDVIEGPTL